jgi:hypothetical protein
VGGNGTGGADGTAEDGRPVDDGPDEPGDEGGGGHDDDGVPLGFLERELSRCRSERVILLLDCRPDEPVTARRLVRRDLGRQLPERLRAPGRAVHATSTAAVIEFLREAARDAGPTGPGTQPRALLASPVNHPSLLYPVSRRSVALAVLAAALLLSSLVVVALSGLLGLLASALGVALGVGVVMHRATREGWGLPPDDTVMGEGIPFYRLYMLRRSQRSKDYFRHH